MSTDTDRIRMLNDQLRRDLTGGRAVMTPPGIAALGYEAVQRLVKTIATFDPSESPRERRANYCCNHFPRVSLVDSSRVLFSTSHLLNIGPVLAGQPPGEPTEPYTNPTFGSMRNEAQPISSKITAWAQVRAS
jgi:hypothetical protein